MAGTAQKTNPKLWEKVKAKITKGDKGGEPGQWSARKAQMAVAEYKKAGGGYAGRKSSDNHLQQWQEEDWGTKSGKQSRDTGERYLPRKSREALTEGEYKRSTEKKKADTRKGKQFSKQPRDVAKKAAAARKSASNGRAASGTTKAQLMEQARSRIFQAARVCRRQSWNAPRPECEKVLNAKRAALKPPFPKFLPE